MQRSLLSVALAVATGATLQAQNCFDVLLGTDLALFDDDVAFSLPLGFTFNYGGVAYTDISVCSNGVIWMGSAGTAVNPFDYSPSETELLAEPPRICPLWTDLDPSATGSGHVFYNTVPGVSATVTWAGVYEYATTNPVDFQVVLDVTGQVTITYGTNPVVGAITSPQAIIGASVGNGAAANSISLALRPYVAAQDTFYEIITSPVPYTAVQMLWSPTTPGYLVLDNPCTMNPLPGPARFEIAGDGCPGRQGPALYQVFDAFGGTVPDLSGLDLSFLPTGSADYIVLPGLSSTYFTGFTNNLGMTDDQSVLVGLPFSFPYGGSTINSIWVSSNGYLSPSANDPGNGCCTGDYSFQSNEPIIAAWWADLYPPGATTGGVFADLDPVSGDFVVSWEQVPEFFSGPAQSAQIALSPTGQFTIRWANVSTTGHQFLAGYLGGISVPDPGQSDLSTITSANVTGTIIVPLTLDAAPGQTPALGSAFAVDVSEIAPTPNGNICILLLSLETPPIPLDGIGATGCTAWLSLPALASFLNVTLGAPTTTYGFNIPSSPAFLGVQLMSQAVSDDANANAFGWRVSNGGRWVFGF